ncbi:MAG: hypothetical protein IPM69_07505 [Ignavibacteria bacterium]|nr:hypothetical protein [Ignavibacteria bacterium]
MIKPSAAIIKNQRHQRAIENNKQSTMNANGITCVSWVTGSSPVVPPPFNSRGT